MNPPNVDRKRPTRSFSLSRESIEKLDDLSRRSLVKRSVILDDIIAACDGNLFLDSLERRRYAEPEEGSDEVTP